MAHDRVADLKAVIELGIEMRDAQKEYFKDRDRSLLDLCRKLERDFDRAAKAVLEERLL